MIDVRECFKFDEYNQLYKVVEWDLEISFRLLAGINSISGNNNNYRLGDWNVF